MQVFGRIVRKRNILFRLCKANVLLKLQELLWRKMDEMFEVVNELALIIVTALLNNLKPVRLW